MRGWLSVAAILLILLASQLSLALLPTLVTDAPVTLLILRPQPEMMILLSTVVNPLVVFFIAAPLRFIVHLTYYEFGRWGGERLVARSRAGRWALRALSRRWLGPALLVTCLVHQSTPVDAALGARATERRRVVAALAIGVSLSSALFIYLGTRLDRLSAGARHVLREYPQAATIVVGAVAASVFLIAAFQTVSAARIARKEISRGDSHS